MSGRSRIEGAALALAALAVAGFLASAGAGLRFRAPAPAADTAAPPRAAADEPAAVAPPPEGVPVRVEVLNATSRAGLARMATERLRAAGIDVVYFGNAGERRGRSIVLDRRGRAAAAHSAAAAIGIAAVGEAPDSTRYVDASVILGADWPPAAPVSRESWLARLRRAIRLAF